MNKHVRNILAALSVMIIAIGLIFSTSDSASTEAALKKPIPTSLLPDADLTASSELLPDQVPEMSIPQNTIQALPVVVQHELPRVAWQAIQGALEPFVVSTQVKEKLTVDTSNNDIGNVTSGEHMNFMLPDGSNVTARVENTWTEANGDKSWTGYVEDAAGPDYRIIVTQGSSATFASINTSKGSYSLESLNGRGVVYKNPEMGDVAPRGSKDYLIPGEQ